MWVTRSLVGLGAVVAAAGAAACGGSGFQFVQNDDLGVYAKLPGDWEIYDEHDLFPEDSDTQLERRSPGHVGADVRRQRRPQCRGVDEPGWR